MIFIQCHLLIDEREKGKKRSEQTFFFILNGIQRDLFIPSTSNKSRRREKKEILINNMLKFRVRKEVKSGRCDYS